MRMNDGVSKFYNHDAKPGVCDNIRNRSGTNLAIRKLIYNLSNQTFNINPYRYMKLCDDVIAEFNYFYDELLKIMNIKSQIKVMT